MREPSCCRAIRTRSIARYSTRGGMGGSCESLRRQRLLAPLVDLPRHPQIFLPRPFGALDVPGRSGFAVNAHLAELTRAVDDPVTRRFARRAVLLERRIDVARLAQRIGEAGGVKRGLGDTRAHV